ncbi:MAG: four helix bundle protein [Patescibacteria group bacterium]
MQNNNSKFKVDLKKRVYLYSLDIIKFIDNLNNKDLTIQIISKQLLRSATSIGANIIEAQAGSSKKDFTNFFNYALKSANESKFWIGLLRDSNKSDKNIANKLLQETNELANILASSILTLKGKNKF